MKVFISWSGKLSELVAKELSEWLPSIIQSVEVFYSPEDIQKGENWDSRLTKELEECKYGIVCLTKENVSAPWVHFEAGALSKSLDSHTSALMIDVVTSDIQGPLSRFQATRFEKDDFYKLVCGINDASDSKISEKVLKNSFEAIWDKMESNIQNIIRKNSKSNKETNKEKNREAVDILEELLQLLRKQDLVLNNPEKLLPEEYFRYLYNRVGEKRTNLNNEEITNFFESIIRYLYISLDKGIDLESLVEILIRCVDFVRSNRRYLNIDIPNRVYLECIEKLQDLRNKKEIE